MVLCLAAFAEDVEDNFAAVGVVAAAVATLVHFPVEVHPGIPESGCGGDEGVPCLEASAEDAAGNWAVAEAEVEVAGTWVDLLVGEVRSGSPGEWGCEDDAEVVPSDFLGGSKAKELAGEDPLDLVLGAEALAMTVARDSPCYWTPYPVYFGINS